MLQRARPIQLGDLFKLVKTRANCTCDHQRKSSRGNEETCVQFIEAEHGGDATSYCLPGRCNNGNEPRGETVHKDVRLTKAKRTSWSARS